MYILFQPGASYGSPTVSDSETGEQGITNPDTNGEWVTKFLPWTDIDSLDQTNVTWDEMCYYMAQGLKMFSDAIHTALPDLSDFLAKGSKLLHYHSEADTSKPPVACIHCHESVRKMMHPDLDFAAGNAAMDEWYKLCLVPGGTHCATNDQQPERRVAAGQT